ncbi:MAG TPA: HD-GYP domain-containing protein [Solirubrobacteraceae bacterium]|nr:HD-GYP domain-containing protein [Solirubrobacteraceae bacterium]
MRLLQYLPLVALTTVSVVVLPAALVAAVVPRGGLLLMAASAAAAVAVSVAIASAEAALWKRRPRSRDLVFADLMLWGWLRRCWTERHLAQARDLYETARKAGPSVSIEVLERLSKLLEARDAYTHGHSQRVARHATRIARAMHISSAEIAKIRTAAKVHDVGKLYTPREILNNPRRLTDAEFAVIKRHPGDGADMLAAVGDPEIAAMVRHHHERMDGHGYPAGLAGSDIPLGARIIAVADTFDAITSSRSYRSAGTHKKALDILSQEAGSQLDGTAVAAFIGRYSARRSVAWCAFATAVPQRIFAGLQTVSPGLGAGTGAVTSILPAIGAASLLTLSPGLHHSTLIGRGTHRQPSYHQATARTRLHQSTTAQAPATTAPRRHAKQRSGAQPTTSVYHPGRRLVRITTGAPTTSTPVSKSPTPTPTASTPTNIPASGTSQAPREPRAGPPSAPPPTTSSPAPTPPPIVPPVNATPTPPTPPAQPVSPPVKLPSVSVEVPPVHVEVPAVHIPSVSLPPVSIPRLGK